MISRTEQTEQLCSELRSISRSGVRQNVEDELRRILESDAFSGSGRSCRFLQHVVDKAMAGEFESLKERILGMELFGRTANFDTDRDSVVRVAASDVRRRLREFYRTRPEARVRIDIPPGVYLPQIEISPLTGKIPTPAVEHAPSRTFPWRAAAIVSTTAAVLLAAAGIGGLLANSAPAPRGPVLFPPWSMLLKPGRVIDIVPADANLVIAKAHSQQDVPIETYNDRTFSYARGFTGALAAYLNHIPLTTLSDTVLVGRISDLATRAATRAQVRFCNRLDMSELKGDVPVVLLGSPTSNPWVQLLYDQLDFQVVHRFEDGFDICMNRNPRHGEQSSYVPTINTGGFSEGYAIVTIVPNLTGRAPVLIIAGTSTECTEAAGEFVTNLDRLSDSLQKRGITPRQPFRKLELLIKTSFVSSSSAAYEIVAHRVTR